MKKTALFLLLNILAGCAYMQGGREIPESRRFIEQELADAAKAIRADLSLMSGSRNKIPEDGFTTSPALMQPVSFSYEGTLQGALEKLCSATGFRLETKGETPLRETSVHLRLNKAPAIHVFREIGTQCSPGERLTLLEERRTVLLEYGEAGKGRGRI